MALETPRPDRALELRDVSKFFGDLPAVRKIQLRVEPGESVFLYGPNGAGKSTLLRILASLGRPSEGQVWFRGQAAHHNPAAIKAAIGFVSHASFLYNELTVRENLRFTGRLFGLRDLEKRIGATLSLVGLEDRGDLLVRELSRGQQQRASLARAFLHDPEFLLLDEPFTGLDAESASNLQALLQRSPERGKAVIFSTHNFEQGKAIARRLVALEAGRILYDGPIDLAPISKSTRLV